MTTTRDPYTRFFLLFRGRGDCYGSWTGGCVKRPASRELFTNHLLSSDPNDWIGSYPLIGDKCSWGCLDIDGKDFGHDWDKMLAIARNYQTAMKVKGIPVHIERSKNGYHVWCFPEEQLIPAWIMRRAQLAACAAIGYKPKEVNPKQEDDRGGVGNYVRLPYPGALADGPPPEGRFFVEMHEGQPRRLMLTTALDLLEAGKATTAALASIAELWVPPTPKVSVEFNRLVGLEAEPLLARINPAQRGLAKTIWRDGPPEGGDRSTALAKLAHLCVEGGLTAAETYVVVDSADQRCGKFVGRDDRELRLEEIVANAY